jgi:hypothetical protein
MQNNESPNVEKKEPVSPSPTVPQKSERAPAVVASPVPKETEAVGKPVVDESAVAGKPIGKGGVTVVTTGERDLSHSGTAVGDAGRKSGDSDADSGRKGERNANVIVSPSPTTPNHPVDPVVVKPQA